MCTVILSLFGLYGSDGLCKDMNPYKRRLVASNEKELCLVSKRICSQQLDVIFDIAYPCGTTFFKRQQECCIPNYDVKTAIEGALQTELDWCKDQLSAGHNFKLKINLETALKMWYVKHHPDVWLCDLVDLKGAIIEVTNRSYAGKQALQHPGFLETAELLWKELNSELSMKRRTIEV